MKERPIIFSTEMVKAILDGRKTMARRVIKPQPYPHKMEARSVFNTSPQFQGWLWKPFKNVLPMSPGYNFIDWRICCPYGQVGEGLWVRETLDIGLATLGYRAGGQVNKLLVANNAEWFLGQKLTYVPSIFMPRWASRLTLEITEVRVERLQEITEEDAKAEGIKQLHFTTGMKVNCLPQFIELWDSLNAKRGYSWDKNPWVWVIKFDNIGVRVK